MKSVLEIKACLPEEVTVFRGEIQKRPKNRRNVRFLDDSRVSEDAGRGRGGAEFDPKGPEAQEEELYKEVRGAERGGTPVGC